MSPRIKLIIAIGAGVVMIVVIGLLIWNRSSAPTNTNVQPGQLSPTAGANKLVVDARQPETAPVVTKETTPELNNEQQSAIAAENLARTFAERFGSYNAPKDFSGITDMQPYMTAAFKTWSQAFVRTLAKQNVSIVTRALSITASEYTATAATVTVSTQRQETKPGQAAVQYKQDLKLQLKYQDGQWLVDAAYWQ